VHALLVFVAVESLLPYRCLFLGRRSLSGDKGSTRVLHVPHPVARLILRVKTQISCVKLCVAGLGSVEILLAASVVVHAVWEDGIEPVLMFFAVVVDRSTRRRNGRPGLALLRAKVESEARPALHHRAHSVGAFQVGLTAGVD